MKVPLLALALVLLLGVLLFGKGFTNPTPSIETFNVRTCTRNEECPRYFVCKEGKCHDPRPNTSF